MKNKINIVFVILLLIIFGLIVYIILSKPVVPVEKFDDTVLREQIRKQDSITIHWQKESIHWQNLATSYELKVDSLEALKPIIHEKYNKQIKFNNSANMLQLDSIIRSTWK